MKRFITDLIVVLVILFFTGCSNSSHNNDTYYKSSKIISDNSYSVSENKILQGKEDKTLHSNKNNYLENNISDNIKARESSSFDNGNGKESKEREYTELRAGREKSTRKIDNKQSKKANIAKNKKSLKNAKSDNNDYLKVKVKKGESLWVISNKYLKDPAKWRELLKYNNIKNPNKIRPGLILRVPDYLSKIVLARISYYSGEVKVKKDNLSDWEKAKINKKLGKSSKVRSYASSRALIKFYTGDRVILKENSLISLSEVVRSKINTISVKLELGNIIAQIRKLKKGRAFNVETPSAVAGVRGTEFIVKSDKKKKSLFGVYDGKILVSAQGRSVVVPAGYGVEVEYGKPPSKLFKLPEKPKILK